MAIYLARSLRIAQRTPGIEHGRPPKLTISVYDLNSITATLAKHFATYRNYLVGRCRGKKSPSGSLLATVNEFGTRRSLVLRDAVRLGVAILFAFALYAMNWLNLKRHRASVGYLVFR